MRNELYQHQKSDSIKWVIVFTALAVLAVGLVAGLFVRPNRNPEEPLATIAPVNPDEEKPAGTEPQPAENGGTQSLSSLRLSSLATTIQNTPQVQLLSASTRSSAGYPQVTVNATVLPETAENQNVTWSISWAQANADAVENYITLNAAGKSATVTCIRSFSGKGNIILTCTTEAGGHMAACTIQFVGRPTELSLSMNGNPDAVLYYQRDDQDGFMVLNKTPQQDCTTVAEVAALDPREEYAFDLVYDNIFGVVGDSLCNVDVQVNLAGTGSFTAYKWSAITGFDTSKRATFKGANIVDEMLEARVANGKLYIRFYQLLEDWFYDDPADGTRYKYYTSDARAPVVFTVTVSADNGQERITSQPVYVIPYSSVSGVSLDTTYILF